MVIFLRYLVKNRAIFPRTFCRRDWNGMSLMSLNLITFILAEYLSKFNVYIWHIRKHWAIAHWDKGKKQQMNDRALKTFRKTNLCNKKTKRNDKKYNKIHTQFICKLWTASFKMRCQKMKIVDIQRSTWKQFFVFWKSSYFISIIFIFAVLSHFYICSSAASWLFHHLRIVWIKKQQQMKTETKRDEKWVKRKIHYKHIEFCVKYLQLFKHDMLI